MRRSIRWCATGAFLAIGSLSNVACQTTQMGQVLPSPYHMLDDIQYFPKGPRFPLANELNAMQAAEAERNDQLFQP